MNRSKIGLEYLRNLAPWKGVGGFTFDNLSKVLNRLGNPQDRVPSVHIAGTNGKGSTAAAVASILGQTGFSVGLNTSPHLVTLNERIVIDGYPLEDEVLGAFAYEVIKASEAINQELTFHEAITAVSFLAFFEQGVDRMVIEVGLGGRLDASNVIAMPSVACISTIDFDHEHILGNSLTEIAREKAGIIKPGCEVVVGWLPEEARAEVKRISQEQRAKLHSYGREFNSFNDGEGHFGFAYEMAGRKGSFNFQAHLPGAHQGHNMAVAIAIGLLLGCREGECMSGISDVFWPGRLERVTYKNRKLIIDCAHNPAGFESLISFLDSENLANLDFTFGTLATKQWEKNIELIQPFISTWRLLDPVSAQCVPASEVAAKLSSIGIKSIQYGNDYEKWEQDTFKMNSSKMPVLVAGSMYMVGKVRGMLNIPPRPLWNYYSPHSQVING